MARQLNFNESWKYYLQLVRSMNRLQMIIDDLQYERFKNETTYRDMKPYLQLENDLDYTQKEGMLRTAIDERRFQQSEIHQEITNVAGFLHAQMYPHPHHLTEYPRRININDNNDFRTQILFEVKPDILHVYIFPILALFPYTGYMFESDRFTICDALLLDQIKPQRNVVDILRLFPAISRTSQYGFTLAQFRYEHQTYTNPGDLIYILNCYLDDGFLAYDVYEHMVINTLLTQEDPIKCYKVNKNLIRTSLTTNIINS